MGEPKKRSLNRRTGGWEEHLLPTTYAAVSIHVSSLFGHLPTMCARRPPLQSTALDDDKAAKHADIRRRTTRRWGSALGRVALVILLAACLYLAEAHGAAAVRRGQRRLRRLRRRVLGVLLWRGAPANLAHRPGVGSPLQLQQGGVGSHNASGIAGTYEGSEPTLQVGRVVAVVPGARTVCGRFSA